MNFELASKSFQTLLNEMEEIAKNNTKEQIDKNWKIITDLSSKITTYLDNYYRDTEQREYQRFTKALATINGNLIIWENSSLLVETSKLVTTILEDLSIKAEKKKLQTPQPKEADIVHSDIHGNYTLEELKDEYDSQVRTNISQGGVLSKTSHLLEQEKIKNEQLQRIIDENKKSISYWVGVTLLVMFFTYINFTAHYLLNVSFNLIISIIVQVIALGMFSILFFREKVERRNIIGSIISTIIATAILFLAGIIAKNLGLI